jgi:hypothetical protein
MVTPEESAPSYNRRGAIPVIAATAADIVELENKVAIEGKGSRVLKRLKVLIPFIAYCAWLALGAMWYALHDGFGWSLAYYTSVDIGLSETWEEPENTPSKFNSDHSKIFTMVHLTIGVIFQGAIVFYIAQEMIKKKGDWMMQAMHRSNLESDERRLYDRLKAFLFLYLARFKVFFLCLAILVAAVIWFANTIDSMSSRTALDYAISSMTGAGYASLPGGTIWWQYIIAATLAGVGEPALTIAIGE